MELPLVNRNITGFKWYSHGCFANTNFFNVLHESRKEVNVEIDKAEDRDDDMLHGRVWGW